MLHIMQEIDGKIRQWTKGKEGNIRSLLSTLQYVSIDLLFFLSEASNQKFKKEQEQENHITLFP